MTYVNTGGDSYGDVNCGLCTIAAIIGTSSGQVAKMLGWPGIESEQSFAAAYLKAHGKDLRTVRLEPDEWQQYSLAGMKHFLKLVQAFRKADCYIAQGGSENSLVPMGVQVAFMKSYAVGTQFAVYGCWSMKGLGAHWNYAIRTADGIEFRDYQYNDSDDHPPKVSSAFIAPRGSPGDSASYVQAVVIVFSPTKNPRL